MFKLGTYLLACFRGASRPAPGLRTAAWCGGAMCLWINIFLGSNTLAAGSIAVAAPHLERIQYYELAIDEQREALRVCEQRLAVTLDAYDAAVAVESLEDAALRNQDYADLNGLRRFYLARFSDTLAKLASEHEQVATKYATLLLIAEALEHTAGAATLWDERAALYDKDARSAVEQGNFDTAGGLYEKVFSTCN